jgi:hypothetical protein
MGIFDKTPPSKIPTGNETPFNYDARYVAGGIEFQCPTCPNVVRVTMAQIDPVIGANVVCTSCRGVAHLPGPYHLTTETTIIPCVNCGQKLRVPFTPPGGGRPVTCPKCRHEFPYEALPALPKARITGSLRTKVTGFSDLYYAHPWITAVVGKGDSDLLNNYGLWAFCAKCLHAFPPSVLTTLAIQQSMAARGGGGFIFNANSNASAADMRGLQQGRCAHCGHDEILVLAAEITESMRYEIKRRTS